MQLNSRKMVGSNRPTKANKYIIPPTLQHIIIYYYWQVSFKSFFIKFFIFKKKALLAYRTLPEETAPQRNPKHAHKHTLQWRGELLVFQIQLD